MENLETPIHSSEKKIVLKAIEDSGPKITVADISQKTGLPVLTSTALLNQIAYETGGHLTVGTAGSVAYQFDAGFQNAYFTRGSKSFFLRMWRAFVNFSIYAIRIFSLAMFFLIRVSFGIILILSVLLVVVLIVVAVVALLARFFGDSDSGDSGFDFGDLLGGLGGFFRYWAFDWLWDWWYWGQYFRYDPYPTYYPSKTYLYDEYGEAVEQKQSKVSFLDKVFSFLFGDGDPNADLQERYWRTLGLVLKAKSGVVVAEELAPYAEVKGSGEDWVLPILVRFNGTCDVSEQGNIIYKFPSFMQNLSTGPTGQTAAAEADKKAEDLRALVNQNLQRQKISANARAASMQLEPFLREIPHVFSNIPESSKITIACFAVLVMFGSLALMALAATVPILLFFSPILMGMAWYGALFLIVPLARFLVMKHLNRGIEERNMKRQAAATNLLSPDNVLRKKLDEAAAARAESVSESSKETIIYTTTEDNLSQEFRERES